MFSRGVPMIVAGDELARTQNGNNNPYNVDSVATWNNYNMIVAVAPQRVPTGATGEAYHDNLGADARPDGRNGLFAFMRHAIGLRHASEALRQGDYTMPMASRRPMAPADSTRIPIAPCAFTWTARRSRTRITCCS